MMADPASNNTFQHPTRNGTSESFVRPDDSSRKTATQTSANFPRTQTCKFDDWKVTITKAPILSSQCTCDKEPTSMNNDIPSSDSADDSGQNSDDTCRKCAFCRNEARLTLKYLPDMVFVENNLRIEHITGNYGVEFNAIDAVNSISDQPSGKIQVASAAVWQESRSEALKTYGSNSVQYDWTYTPHYQGTLFGGMQVEATNEKLNMEMLKRKDPVLLFDEIQLYGDELDDNGCSELELKIRIVEGYLFVLMRFYLRVDHVFVRLYDTRLLLEKGKTAMLREFTVRECRIPELPEQVSAMDPMAVWSALQPTQECHERLVCSKEN